MKKIQLSLALLLSGLSIAHADRVRVTMREGSNGGNNGGPSAPSGGGSGNAPATRYGSSGSHGSGRVRVTPIRSRVSPSHQSIAVNRSVARQIRSDGRVKVVPNRYYWHNAGGTRYAQYYWHGHNWYGFHSGPSFYWTRWHADHWWWYDVGFNRWVFWNGGYWWWPAPGGVLYVNVNNDYYPYGDAPVSVARPEIPSMPEDATPPPTSTAATTSTDATWKSKDGTRMAQVVGADSEAFLYDTSNGTPRFMLTLGKNVDRIRFTGGTTGKPLQILVDYKDGRFKLVKADGSPEDGSTDDETPDSPDSGVTPPVPPESGPN